MPKVSVIVPIYNVQEFLPKCLESLVNQTLQDIQIILVNDGSQDNSGKIAEEFQNRFPDKIMLLNKENGGLSDARNFGLPYATGEFIAFLDSDDYIEKNAYEMMYQKAIDENADYVECDFYWEYPNDKKIDKCNLYFGKKEMLTNVRVVAWNKLIKRQIIEEHSIYFPKGLRYEDVQFTYQLVPYLERTSYVNQPFIHYVQREDSIANSQNERNREIFEVLDNVISYYQEHGFYDEYRYELEYLYTRYSLCSSLRRICKIEDKVLRKQLIQETWENLNDKFPNWKKNKVLVSDDLFKNLYMRTVNRVTYHIYTFLLKFI